MEKYLTILGRKISLKMFNNEPKQNTNSEMKKFERISAILGKEVTAETVLTVEEMEMIENHSDAAPKSTTQPAPTAEEIAASMSGPISEAVATAVAPLQETLTALETRIGQMEEGAGAQAAVTTPTVGASGTPKPLESWEDPEDPINRHFSEQIGE